MIVMEEISSLTGIASTSKFLAGQKVIWTARLNNPQNYPPGAKLGGIIIDVYNNGVRFVYRIRLNFLWKDYPGLEGTNVIVGNIMEHRISLPE